MPPIPIESLGTWSKYVDRIRDICATIPTDSTSEFLVFSDPRLELTRARDPEGSRVEARLGDASRTLVCLVDDENQVHVFRVGVWLRFVDALSARIEAERARLRADEREREAREHALAFDIIRTDLELFEGAETSLPAIDLEHTALEEPRLPFSDDALLSIDPESVDVAEAPVEPLSIGC